MTTVRDRVHRIPRTHTHPFSTQKRKGKIRKTRKERENTLSFQRFGGENEGGESSFNYEQIEPLA